MPTPKPILIVQGAQFGSEGKGGVAAALCERRSVKYAVRTGAVNAGHCVYYKGKKYVNQQLPTGWVCPGTNLVIGPGAYVNPEILANEVHMIMEATSIWPRIWIDHRAGLHLPEHTLRAQESGRHYRIGATAKGCSEAIIDRIKLRGNGGRLFFDWVKENPDWVLSPTPVDTVEMLNDAYDAGEQILLEGTQGTLLDLYLGPYPYTTHKQCTAAQWVTEAGLSPSLEYEVVLVARTYPIRVAGNSGPMKNEITWPLLADEINKKLRTAGKPPLVDSNALAEYQAQYARFDGLYATELVEKSCRPSDALISCDENTQRELRKLFEFTTVTKKLRRVARLSIEDLKYSVMINRPSWVCLTFMNYEFPERWGITGGDALTPSVADSEIALRKYRNWIQSQIGCRILGESYGPEPHNLITWGSP